MKKTLHAIKCNKCVEQVGVDVMIKNRYAKIAFFLGTIVIKFKYCGTKGSFEQFSNKNVSQNAFFLFVFFVAFRLKVACNFFAVFFLAKTMCKFHIAHC